MAGTRERMPAGPGGNIPKAMEDAPEGWVYNALTGQYEKPRAQRILPMEGEPEMLPDEPMAQKPSFAEARGPEVSEAMGMPLSDIGEEQYPQIAETYGDVTDLMGDPKYAKIIRILQQMKAQEMQGASGGSSTVETNRMLYGQSGVRSTPGNENMDWQTRLLNKLGRK